MAGSHSNLSRVTRLSWDHYRRVSQCLGVGYEPYLNIETEPISLRGLRRLDLTYLTDLTGSRNAWGFGGLDGWFVGTVLRHRGVLRCSLKPVRALGKSDRYTSSSLGRTNKHGRFHLRLPFARSKPGKGKKGGGAVPSSQIITRRHLLT